jgi:hypothetical protein
MRVIPTSVEFSTLKLWWAANATAVSALALGNDGTTSIANLNATVTGGFSIGQHGQFIGNGASSYLGISAEL